MADTTAIAEIIDATAALARRITGVASAYGVGSGLVTDIYSGQPVPAAPSNALAIGPGVHVSRWPEPPAIRYLSATVAEYVWQIPMDLSLVGPDLATLLPEAIVFFARYTTMFAQHSQLLRASDGTPRCNSALITSARPRQDPPTLEFVLTVVERLNLDLLPGGTV